MPEDRLASGVSAASSVQDNVAGGYLRSDLCVGMLRGRLLSAWVGQLIRHYDVRGADPATPVGALSGGNVQKVVIARELESAPEVLLSKGSQFSCSWPCSLISGALCGLAGAQLAMATLGQFTADMAAGRGYIALAAIFAGAARPIGTAVACLVFGLVSSLANQLQLEHYNTDIMLMLPYVVTVLVLLGRLLLHLVRQRRRERKGALIT